MSVSNSHSLEVTQGKLSANSTHETMPLFDCDLNGNHLASLFASCEGGNKLGVIGYVWEYGGGNRIPLYRCTTTNSAGIDHFVSVDSQCEGQQIEGLLGYVLP